MAMILQKALILQGSETMQEIKIFKQSELVLKVNKAYDWAGQFY